MKICCLGDSLTEGDYGVFGKSGVANIKSENYPYFLSKLISADVINYGKCGYRTLDYLNFYKDGYVNVKGADIVIIMLGTNGGHSADASSDNDNAMRELVDIIRQDEPSASLVLCTSPHATENPYYSNCGYMGNVKAAGEATRIIASEKNTLLIDVGAFPAFCAETECIFQCADGVHFTELGYRVLAAFIGSELKRLLPEKFVN